MHKQSDEYYAQNFFVCFVDLLGQRHALANQELVPIKQTPEEIALFHQDIKASIMPILRLQQRAEEFFGAMDRSEKPSSLREALSEQQRIEWDAMKATNVKSQRWSDGLVHFVGLGDKNVRCPMNGVFSLLGAAANHSLMGLAEKNPIRCAIDVAWAVELHERELYGAAVARAYELESEVAQYPRAVIGRHAFGYLEVHAKRPLDDHFAAYEAEIAQLCLQLITTDDDGVKILHYLGPAFQKMFPSDLFKDLYERGFAFINAQLEVHQSTGNKKLEDRYGRLQNYFRTYPPSV